MKFTQERLTDQKRMARAQHLLYARTLLRREAEQHHCAWRVAILAGGSPAGEINAIRELMPKAKITAIDKDGQCLEAAIDAGADDVLLHDLSETEWGSNRGSTLRKPNIEPFDLAHIDLCANPNPLSQKIARKNLPLVQHGGVYIFAFSYGRDVQEMFVDTSSDVRIGSIGSYSEEILTGYLNKVPALIRGRLHYLFKSTHLKNLRSVICYQGSRMPMCSALFHKRRSSAEPVSFVNLEPGDFEIQVTEGIDMTRLFDCPQDRIEALRRKHAAIKASYTRQKRLTASNPEPLLESL